MKNKFILVKLQTLTNMFAAYFMNKSDEIGINFNKRKIIDNEEYEIINDYLYISFPILFHDECKHVHYLHENNLIGFFRLHCIPIINESDQWNTIKKIQEDKSIRFKFVELPEQVPFYSWIFNDPETGVNIRATYGLMLSMNETCIMFDMHLYLVRKI